MRRTPTLLAGLTVVVVLLVALGVLLGGDGDRDDTMPSGRPTAESAPITLPTTTAPAEPRFSKQERRAIRRDQARAAGEPPDEIPDDEAMGTQTVATDGALLRSLPVTAHGWRFSLQSISAKDGVAVLTATPIAGQGTERQADRALRQAARASGDDPAGYRVVIPMTALKNRKPHPDLPNGKDPR